MISGIFNSLGRNLHIGKLERLESSAQKISAVSRMRMESAVRVVRRRRMYSNDETYSPRTAGQKWHPQQCTELATQTHHNGNPSPARKTRESFRRTEVHAISVMHDTKTLIWASIERINALRGLEWSNLLRAVCVPDHALRLYVETEGTRAFTTAYIGFHRRRNVRQN